MPINKKQADYYLWRIYKLMKDEQFPTIFQKIKKNRGEIDWVQIKLDPRDEILSTFIHECLHILYPNNSETVIKNLESQIVNKLSQKQFKNLLLRLALTMNNLS